MINRVKMVEPASINRILYMASLAYVVVNLWEPIVN